MAQCIEIFFELNEMATIVESFCPIGNCSGVTGVLIRTTNSIIIYKEEQWLYGVENMIADVGGYLGLLLGASVLTMFDGVSEWVKKTKSKVNLMEY